jgi:hypothetical protein
VRTASASSWATRRGKKTESRDREAVLSQLPSPNSVADLALYALQNGIVQFF